MTFFFFRHVQIRLRYSGNVFFFEILINKTGTVRFCTNVVKHLKIP